MAELTKQDIKEAVRETFVEVFPDEFSRALEPFAKAIQEDIQGVKEDIQGVKGEVKEGFQRVEERLIKIEESDIYNTKWLQGIDQRLTKVERKVDIVS